MANQGYRRLDENYPRRLEAGFDFSFTLPYKADDVFKEVRCQVTIRPQKSSHRVVRSRTERK